MRYKQVHDGDLVTPIMKGYKVVCCDCGKVHRFDFFISKGYSPTLSFRVTQDKRATAAVRRKKRPVQGLSALSC